MQAAPPPGTTLCALDDLRDPGAKGFTFRDGEALFNGFVVRKGEAVFGYRDVCPHAGWPLALAPDQYLTREGDLILCAGHGALFRLEDGLCIGGPCGGRRLAPWPVRVEDSLVRAA
jgi:nitrite reductase/ring-hydroxylating ferredoxin subunit